MELVPGPFGTKANVSGEVHNRITTRQLQMRATQIRLHRLKKMVTTVNGAPSQKMAV